jgi:CRISPR-associated protein Csd1
MISKLVEYYNCRKDSGLAPLGFEWKEITYIIALDQEGIPITMTDTREKKKAKSFLVPKSESRGMGIVANKFYDNQEYALGVAVPGKNHLIKKHQAFIDAVRQFDIDDEGCQALLKFLERDNKEELLQGFQEWQESQKKQIGWFSFALVGDQCLICERPKVVEKIKGSNVKPDTNKKMGYCCISGKYAPLEKLHHKILGFGQSTGVKLVSFDKPSFQAYGLDSGFNSPMSEEVVFGYTTALNHLIKKQSMRLGNDLLLIFWAAKKNQLEDDFLDLFGESRNKDDDQKDNRIKAIKSLYASVNPDFKRGNRDWIDEDDDTEFHLIGITPNGGRIVIQFEQEDTVAGLGKKIIDYFEDIKIKDDFYPSTFQILCNLSVKGDIKNLSPNLARDFFLSIITGKAFPSVMLHACLDRIYAECGKVNDVRASMLKGYLNRIKKETIKMALDKENSNAGYVLGRLFALLEIIQRSALGKVNVSIRDKYYTSASRTPGIMFPQLVAGVQRHFGKIKKEGLIIFYQRQIQEMLSKLSGIPCKLDVLDQAQFSLGYYHQREEIFKKKDDKNSVEKEIQEALEEVEKGEINE